MTFAFTILSAVAVALLFIFGASRMSMWMTDRKSNEALKRRIPDASSVNADSGYATPTGGD